MYPIQMHTIRMMKTQCGVINVQFACLISGSCVCAWVFVWEGEGGRLRESVCLIMADGSSDDDVIHLASFNTHRGRGTNIEPLFWCILSTLLEVIVVFWAFWPLFCFVVFFLLAKRIRTRTSYITISSSSDSDDEPVRFVPNVPVVVKDDEEEDVRILEVTRDAFQFTGCLCSIHCCLHT